MSTTNGATILRSRTDTAKDRPTVNVAGGVVYSKIAPHTAAAGDPYYIGDAYDKIPLQISQEWETDLYAMSHMYKPLYYSWQLLICALRQYNEPFLCVRSTRFLTLH